MQKAYVPVHNFINPSIGKRLGQPATTWWSKEKTMLYVVKIAALIKATNLIMDSEFAILDDGMYTDKPVDNLQKVRFLNTIETLKAGFENEKYCIKLVPVRFSSTDIFYPLVDADKKQRYVAKSKPIADILNKFSKKLGVEVRDPSELSEFQRAIMRG